MRLPHSERAVITQEKVRNYLLSRNHLVGRHKAAFFKAVGYSQDEWQLLEQELRRISRLGAELVEVTEFGCKYIIRARIRGPTGRTARVVTVWMVRRYEACARFITAYPEG